RAETSCDDSAHRPNCGKPSVDIMLSKCSGNSVQSLRAARYPGVALAAKRIVRVASAASRLEPESYCVLVRELQKGLAHCFEKSDEGKLVDRMVIEPLSASSMECLATGAQTSFKVVAGVTLGTALARDLSQLPAELQSGRFCDTWDVRCEAAARTWTRPHAQDNLMDLVPLGRVRGSFNFSLEDKRVLNLTVEIKDEDNVKQDMSIDVYGRKEKSEAAEAKVAAALSKQEAKEQEQDELDQLLAL
ncbi:hypothetical protein QJQ45_021403, partial [Haematococcus lacustris]